MRLFRWFRRPLTEAEIEARTQRKSLRLIEMSRDGLLKPGEFEEKLTRLHHWADTEIRKIRRQGAGN